MKSNIYISLLFCLLTLNSCFLFGSDDDDMIVDDSTSETPTADAIIYANFTNDGVTQNLTLDQSLLSGPVQIENEAIFSADGSRFYFEFSGVSFSENTSVYEIQDIITQTNSENQWSPDSENFLQREFSKSLDIVLVLDVSSSLAENINSVKNNAVSMLQNIFFQNSEAKVAVVKFSRGNVSTNLSSDLNFLSNFILNNSSYTDNILSGGTYFLEGKSETALYEAMLKGVEILNNSNARGKGLITFTDGKNNFQFDLNNDNKNVVIDALNTSNVKSYTIGFIGNNSEIIESTLIELAVAGDYSSANLSQLDQTFSLFSNSVSAIYDLTYNTNNAPFSGTRRVRFLIDLNQIN